MKTSQPRHLKASALVLASLSALAVAQPVPTIPPAKVHIDKVIVGTLPHGYTPTFSYDVKVTELLPPAPPNCAWNPPAYSPTNSTVAVNSGGQPGTVVVKNLLVCHQSQACAAVPPSLPPIKLSLAASWLTAPVTPYPSPATRVHVTAGPPMWASGSIEPGEWVGITANGSGPFVTYDTEIPFCLCNGGSAYAKVYNYRSDNEGELFFDTPPSFLVPATGSTSYLSSGSGSSGSPAPVSSLGQHRLISRVRNSQTPPSNSYSNRTGFAMQGDLIIKQGYLGVCKP